jgi:hypothetical protein
MDIDGGGSRRRVGNLEFCDEGNVMRREDVGGLVGEVSSLKAKSVRETSSLNILVTLTRRGILTRESLTRR